MKLVINYDFFNAVRNVNEPLTPMKIVRNNKKYIYFNPIAIGLECINGSSVESICYWIIFVNGIWMTTDLLIDFAFKKAQNVDIYAYNAIPQLKKLSTMLEDINVKTNYDMILKSELYEKKYKIEPMDRKIPKITEQKYIYVPSYGFDGKEKETSILQEHDIGSGLYTLSVGEPEKQYRRVLVNNHA